MQLLGEIGPLAAAAVPRLKEIIQATKNRPDNSKIAAETLKEIEATPQPQYR
jgi:hypothetical protein